MVATTIAVAGKNGTRKVTEIVFRNDLYPRMETSATTVQSYAEDLEVLPPIEINQHNELIDGWHRWTAHKKAAKEDIAVIVTPTSSDSNLLELAIRRNATYGLRLSPEDKRDTARKIYHSTPERERERKKADLASLLSVSDRTLRTWLSRIDKDTKEARNKRIFDLWLACYTQEEIAEKVGCPRETVRDVIGENGNLAESAKPIAEHLVDFEPPIYNVWKQQTKTNGSTHPGNSEITFVDRLLYLYTKPFDIVVDTFAGGGSTVGLCKKRYRRYWVSDRIVQPELEQSIRKWDITDGLPPLPRWEDVSLVYLDPPYWKQVEGVYSKDATDLANMDLATFNSSLAGLINGFAKKLHKGSHIALLIQPTQWNAPGHQFTDHVKDMLGLVKASVDMRFSCPYESQQYNAQMVEWAKANRKTLVLTRELVVWGV